jgi:hypothetical protein
MSGIDPKWPTLIGVLVVIEQAIGQGTVKLTDAIPAGYIPIVTSWCNILAFVGTTIMTAMTAYSSKASGPLTK